MALGIPLPGDMGEALLKGVNTGSGMFARLMQPILEREKLAQQEKQFQQDLAMRKAAAGRAGANADLNRQILQQQLLGLQHQNDPMYGMNQVLSMQKLLGGEGTAPQQNMPMPTQETGEGMGMFMPETLGSMQPPAMQSNMQPQAQPAPSINYELLKQNPMMRAFVKKQLGYDPLATVPQTPEQKEQSQFDLFKKKEEYKAQQEQKLPAAVKTLHENIIQLSPKAVTAIQHIIDIPSPFETWGTGALFADQKAAHKKAVTAAAENYAKAKGWPNTKGSIEKAESILQRGNYETDPAYRIRLKEYQDELDEGVVLSNQLLHPNKQPTPSASGNIIEYERVNGKLVPKKAAK